MKRLGEFLVNFYIELMDSNSWMSTAAILVSLHLTNISKTIVIICGLIRVFGATGKAAIKTWWIDYKLKQSSTKK